MTVDIIACVVPLSWEVLFENEQISQKHLQPERKAWSDVLYRMIDERFEIFRSAADITTIVPNIENYSKRQIITYIAELFCGIALYESDWNPECVSIDVNGENLPEKMATGLFQLNEEDQKSFNTGTAYKYTELSKAIPNIEAAVGIMGTQIENIGKIILRKGVKAEKGVFWAVLHPDGDTDKTSEILAMVRSIDKKIQNSYVSAF
jgi:hypothetical protein